MDTGIFFDELWRDYTRITPQAERIRSEFERRGETVLNDHVAFRTLGVDPIGIERLEVHLLALGYKRYEPYEFPAKKLRAFGYLPPSADLPRVFLSELKIEELSPPVATILERCAFEVAVDAVSDPAVLWSGCRWSPVSVSEYEALVAESEYAAWFATMGFHANHFTISVNGLSDYPDVESVLEVVESLGYSVNDSGGRVKGSPAQLLEQGSTLADQIEVGFADGESRLVPTCYYEFAKRYPTTSGELFNGFVASSADKIFESTDTKTN